ncbi:hypothetical protein NM208_g1473 [Fusarium decemcellulare]|uniref:Uncharacterized protein n=1 Tax=Fusarium decemcellulare TaxID=57161 RepID=A0ACC1SW00_9HYPO|nr:hypothetical protein NM208_g1473 [Fusarium decemcellulare]
MEGEQRQPEDGQRPIPGDATKATRKQSVPNRRSDYLEEVFAPRDVDNLSGRVRSESMVLAEVKTNVVVNDEYTFVSELSDHLAIRYSRPVSSIAVTLQHGACILFSGSCDPAYIMTVEALACYVQTATNKRNMALLQRHMEQALGVRSSRGFLKFIPVPEECAGWKGKTVAGEIAEAMEQAQSKVEHGDAFKTPRRKSSKAHGDVKGGPAAENLAPSLGVSRSKSAEEPRSSKDTVEGEPGAAKEKPRMMKRRKSFIQALFPKSSSRPASGGADGD